ncbi:hypothetical protein PR003_g14723 [Phytophthora rubi]|uniref:Uncharacterized protein n=1 Tax=Phytophthora rubi TaxID=129364 RepID=A0A6A4ETY8_9STRA|nr:hypothetical protein PR002_g15772 [Phytophthora rubi]KAE9013766.1 hypothetical protein PR001_g15315 [Phytophthora rubi]KAE9332028.1 hypothetical protein PR003_g14723 [Phytophthora rubi]
MALSSFRTWRLRLTSRLVSILFSTDGLNMLRLTLNSLPGDHVRTVNASKLCI